MSIEYEWIGTPAGATNHRIGVVAGKTFSWYERPCIARLICERNADTLLVRDEYNRDHTGRWLLELLAEPGMVEYPPLAEFVGPSEEWWESSNGFPALLAAEREQDALLVERSAAAYWLASGRGQHWDAADSLTHIIRRREEPPQGEDEPSEEALSNTRRKMNYREVGD